jgi:hypothetical protein
MGNALDVVDQVIVGEGLKNDVPLLRVILVVAIKILKIPEVSRDQKQKEKGQHPK